MSDYRRWISYIYAYENGVKKKNAGYAKLELKDGKLTMTLHVTPDNREGNYRVCLYKSQSGRREGVLLGDVEKRQGGEGIRFQEDASDLKGSGLLFQEMNGLLLYDERGKYLISSWEDEPVEIPVLQEIVAMLEQGRANAEAARGEQGRQTGGKDVLREESTIQEVRENRVGNTQNNRMGNSQSDGAGNMQNNGIGNTQNNRAGNMQNNGTENTQNNRTGNTQNNGTANTRNIGAGNTQDNGTGNTQNNGMGNSQNNGAENTGIRSTEKTDNTVRTEGTERTMKTEIAKDERGRDEGNTEKENRQAEMGITAQEEKKAEMRMQTVVQTEKKVLPPGAESEKTGIVKPQEKSAAVQRNAGEAQPEETAKKEEIPVTQKEEKSAPDSTKPNTAPAPGKLEARLFSCLPAMYPFEHQEFERSVRMEPQDIGLLPREMWKYAGNSFLLHSYYAYHHILFTRKVRKDGRNCYLMLPGIYNPKEQHMAQLFGFSRFCPVHKKALQQGDFGYWYMEVEFPDSIS